MISMLKLCYIRAHTHIYIYIYIHMYTHIYISVCMCVCMYVRTYIYIYIYIYIHTLLGGALDALKFQCAQRDSLSQLFLQNNEHHNRCKQMSLRDSAKL